MNPCELNLLISSAANYLYANLSKDDFYCLNIVLSELSKSMFSMSLMREVCDKKNPKRPCRKEKETPCSPGKGE